MIGADMNARQEPQPAGHRLLVVTSAALLVSVALHGIDHALQDRGIGALSTEVLIGGTVNATAAVGAFWLALQDYPRAPQALAFIGTYIAFGVTAAHFMPHWSALSDPYVDLDLQLISWAAAASEVIAAAALGAAGFAVLRRRREPGRIALS
jgi:hypothetical protein